MKAEKIHFECMNCERSFSDRWFEVGRSFERVRFNRPTAMNEVEITDADGIGVFCSRDCRDSCRGALMQNEQVPVPSDRPGIEPVERCAKCTGPVDMSDWHLTYTEGECEEIEFGVRVNDFDYVAVVCRVCEQPQKVSRSTPIE